MQRIKECNPSVQWSFGNYSSTHLSLNNWAQCFPSDLTEGCKRYAQKSLLVVLENKWECKHTAFCWLAELNPSLSCGCFPPRFCSWCSVPELFYLVRCQLAWLSCTVGWADLWAGWELGWVAWDDALCLERMCGCPHCCWISAHGFVCAVTFREDCFVLFPL